MIKWHVEGLQVVCLPVTQLLLGKCAPQAPLGHRACDMCWTLSRASFEEKKKGPTIVNGADALAFVAFVAFAVVAPVVLTRSECDAKGA